MILLIVFTSPIAEAQAQTRSQIRVVGSSTVFPFAKAVAEEFGRSSGFRTPIIEATGSGGGFKLFCSGIGTSTPDITTSSRRIKESELKLCERRGVTNISEMVIGYDGVVVAAAKEMPPLHLSMRELYLALAAYVPKGDHITGREDFIPNPYKSWHDINPDFPDRPILVLGPPPTSGTRDALSEVVLESGCRTIDGFTMLKETDPKGFAALCRTVREDGAYVDSGENDNLIVQKLLTNHNAVGIFGFNFLDQNMDIITAYPIIGSNGEAITPSFDAIFEGTYPISRSLYLYVKDDHIGVVPGIAEYLREFRSEKASGPFGYLLDRGLVPLHDSVVEKQGIVALYPESGVQ